MTKPVRIQRKRTKGFDLQAASRSINGLECVYVGRPTKWGNPFVVGKSGGVYTAKVKDLRHAYLLYKSIALDNAQLIFAARAELRGKNLACFCQQENSYEDCCHAAVLLELANGDEP